MSIQMPSGFEIDRSRKGKLAIDPVVFGELFGLPPHLQVVAVRNDDVFRTVLLLIEGVDMPAHELGAAPEPVRLICHRAENDRAVTVYAEWEHRPGHRWIVNHRPKAELCPPSPGTSTKLDDGHYWVRLRSWHPGTRPRIAEYAANSGWFVGGGWGRAEAIDVIVLSGRLPPPPDASA